MPCFYSLTYCASACVRACVRVPISTWLRICALCAHLYLPIITVRAPCAHHTNINMEPYTCTCCCLKYHAIIIDFTPLYQYLTLLYCQWYNSPYMSHNISLELVDIVKYFCKIIRNYRHLNDLKV